MGNVFLPYCPWVGFGNHLRTTVVVQITSLGEFFYRYLKKTTNMLIECEILFPDPVV